MAQSARGLGRGLEALLGGIGDARAAAEIMLIPLRAIRPNPDQPRREFSGEALEDLARSIKEQGVLQPVLVRPVSDADSEYEIVAGERRWRACALAGLEEIPALVREVDDEQSLALALIENLQREDLNPMEEAAGYAQLVSRFGLSQEDLAARVGKSRSAVANTMRLLQLSEAVRADLGSGLLSAGHARALLSLADEALREALWRRITELGLSVRQAEDLAAYAKEHGAFPPPPEAAATDGRENAAPAEPAGRKGPAAKRGETHLDPEFAAIQDGLEALFGTRVRLAGTPGRGRVTIHFGTREAFAAMLERFGYTRD
jgi:ParB family chromosome partitioning protein